MADQSQLAPTVSVIVPAFAAADTLEDAVLSVLTEHETPVEVIVVADGGTDGTLSVAQRCAADDRVVVVSRDESGGPSTARNEGLRIARGDFVLFLDADDQLMPHAITTLVKKIGGAVASMGRFVAVDDEGNPLDIGTWAEEQLRPVVRRHGKFVDSAEGFSSEALLTRLVTPPPGGILVRRSTALAIGGYDVTLQRSEDIDFLVRLSSQGLLVAVDDVVLRYRRRSTQRSANSRRRRAGRQRALYLLVWHAPSRSDARQRTRGIVSHHVDRAQTRWNFGERRLIDAVVTLRSYGLALAFYLVGHIVALSRTRRPTL